MGYEGQTVNGLSSLGPKMGKASGGGVKLEQGLGKISQSEDDVFSGKETQMEDNSMASAKIHSGGFSKGNFGTPHKFKGPERALVGKQPNLPQVVKDQIAAARYEKGGAHKESQDHKMAYDRSEISRLKGDIHFDDIEKKK